MSEKEENCCSIRDEVTEDTQASLENATRDEVTEDQPSCLESAIRVEVTEDKQACLESVTRVGVTVDKQACSENATDLEGSDDDADLEHDVDAFLDLTRSNTVNIFQALFKAEQAKDMEAYTHSLKSILSLGPSPRMSRLLETDILDAFIEVLFCINELLYGQSEDQLEINTVMQRVMGLCGIHMNTEMMHIVESCWQEMWPLFIHMLDDEAHASAALKYAGHNLMDARLSSDIFIQSLPADNPWHLLSNEEVGLSIIFL